MIYEGQTLEQVEKELTPAPVLAFVVGALGGLAVALMYRSARRQRYAPAMMQNATELERNYKDLKREAKQTMREVKAKRHANRLVHGR
jgi:hypothetical protein